MAAVELLAYMPKSKSGIPISKNALERYDNVLADISVLLEQARHASARTVNSIMTATYWQIGRRLVEYEQGGASRAEYGKAVLKRLAADLVKQFGRGFSERNLELMRQFYLGWQISQTASAESQSSGEQLLIVPEPISQTVSAKFPLSWSHYVRLMSVKSSEARAFYENEALRGGWSVRQLDRQISTQFYERLSTSRNKAAMLRKAMEPHSEDIITPEEEIKDPFVLEFLNLKDEYSETELETALIHHLEAFLLELGNDFTFVGRQKRLRIADEWYRVDLVFYHRRLRCLLLADLKIGKFTHSDVGQMHLYLNYAREHWTHPEENPPVGLILCQEKKEAVAHYALSGLTNRILAAEYHTTLPDEKLLTEELERMRKNYLASVASQSPKALVTTRTQKAARAKRT